MELSAKLLEDYEFMTPSLSSMTDAGHAFSIPWDRQVRAMMAGFDSAGMKDKKGPWKLSTPFDLSGMTLSTIVPDTSGGIASFRDGFNTQSGASTEHLSAALGITVGYPFLNASVSGKYDKNVMRNNNGIRASRNATCRMGRVVLDSSPILSQSALALLDSADGPARFRAAYGDYYICGYELGADAGVCLSASTESTTTTQSLEITVAVKVLFYTASKTHTESSSSFSTSSSMTFCGYNSLDQKTDELTSPDKSTWEQQARLRDASAEYMKKVGSLDSEVRVSMARLGLEDAHKLPLSVCLLICQSGLVVELLLAPFARLNQYVERASRLQVKPHQQGNLGLDDVPKKQAVPAQTGVGKPVTTKDSVNEILGETRLFIAAEYIERQYSGGPMEDFHIRDLAGHAKDDEGNSWITMQLDDCFHYGQNGSGSSLNRFIVYHPPIAPTFRAPRMFQHRFTGLTSAGVAKAASEDLPELAPDYYRVAAVAGSKLTGYAAEVVKGIAGHPLHQYLGVAGIKKAKERQGGINWTKAKEGSRFSDETKRIVVLQIVEGLKDKEENAQSDREQLKREEEAHASLKRLISQIEETSDTIKKKFSLFTWLGFGKNPTDKAKAMALSEAVVIGSQDGDAAVLSALGETVGPVAGLTPADIEKAADQQDTNEETGGISSTTLADNKDKTLFTKDLVVEEATSKPPIADQEKSSSTIKLPLIPATNLKPSLVQLNVTEIAANSSLARNVPSRSKVPQNPALLRNVYVPSTKQVFKV